MIGAAIGAGMGALGSIFGGRAAKKAAKKANAILDQQLKDNQNWYNLRYNENYTQRSDAQQVLNYAKEQAENLYKRAEGMGAVTGATDESLALQKAAGSDLIADTASNIAAQADAYKQGIEQQYLSNKAGLNQQKIGVLQQKAQGIANATAQLGNVGSSLIGADAKGLFKDLFKKKGGQ